jgi:hypothetical protein
LYKSKKILRNFPDKTVFGKAGSAETSKGYTLFFDDQNSCCVSSTKVTLKGITKQKLIHASGNNAF